MSAPIDREAIRAEVERNLATLEGSTEDQLLAAIGTIPLTPAFTDVPPPEALSGYGLPGFDLARLGQAFLDANDKVRDVVCNNKGEFSGLITADNITTLLSFILPALGASVAGAPPAAAIALAVFILKIGLNQYCRKPESD